ncbi:MAG: hypothetical protein U9P79_08935 [Candidatus Cloacimonadota bacterium]|nr:hypothetical protein [Candidatus Cloacimonadota bacterium]
MEENKISKQNESAADFDPEEQEDLDKEIIDLKEPFNTSQQKKLD